jgi:aryl-alcohol dehydrogenase
MRIKAAVVWEKSGSFRIEDIDLDEPKDDEVLVRVAGAGICHTDLVARDGHLPMPLPAVLGHEGAGVVEKVGSRVAKVKPGDHVVISYASCGICAPCQTGKPTYCSDFFRCNFLGARPDGSQTMRKDGKVVHGAFFGQSSFASHALALERNVVAVRADVPLELLGPLGCGIQTGAGGVMNSLNVRPGSSIAIFGVGSVGLSAVLAAVICGCTTIIAVDVRADRLTMARGFGATHIIEAGKANTVDEIRSITGTGVEYSLECTGIPAVFRAAVDALCRLGVCGLIGVAPQGVEVRLDMETILNGRTVRGIVEGDSVPDIFIPRLMDLFMQGRFPFDRMITLYPFSEINKAVEDSEKGKVLKAVIRPA